MFHGWFFGWLPRFFHGFGFGRFDGFGLIETIFMLFVFLAAIAGIVLLAAVLIRRATAGGPSLSAQRFPAEEPASASEILKIRYARGEITREQYQEMMSDLNS